MIKMMVNSKDNDGNSECGLVRRPIVISLRHLTLSRELRCNGHQAYLSLKMNIRIFGLRIFCNREISKVKCSFTSDVDGKATNVYGGVHSVHVHIAD